MNIILLFAGFLLLNDIHILPELAFYGFTTMAWMVLFVVLTQKAKSKKELWITGLVFSAGYICRFWGLTGSIILDIVGVGIVGASIYGLILIYRMGTRKWRHIWVTLLFPFLWGWIYLALTFLRIPIFIRVDIFFFELNKLMQNVAVLGAYLFSYLIIWIVALIAYSWMNKKWNGLLVAVLLMGILYLNGAGHMPSVSEDTVRVAYTTGPYVGDFMNCEELEYAEVEKSLDRSMDTAAEQGAKILAFNEEAFEIDDQDEARFLEFLQQKAKEKNLHVLVGLDVYDTDNSDNGKSYNKAIWITNEGELPGEYVKQKTIPFVENDYVRGKEEIPNYTIDLDGREIKIAFGICYDSNFPLYIKKIDDDTDFLFLLSWDWKAVSLLHSKICGTNAIENRVSMLKPTYDGISIAVDPSGKILKLSDTAEIGYETVEIVELPIGVKEIQ